jgi:hypothetical protein
LDVVYLTQQGNKENMENILGGMWIPNLVWTNEHLRPNDKLVFGLLFMFDKVTISEMIKLCKKNIDIGKNATLTSYKNLENQGFLLIKRNGVGKEIFISARTVI